MDKYLKENSAYERLWAEYHKYNSLIIAVDYDDTLFDFHGSGDSYEMVKQLVRDLHDIGCIIIIWSGNEDKVTVESFLNKNDIPWHLINENHMVNGKYVSGKDSRKVYANAYLDDRAGLVQTYGELSQLVQRIKQKRYYRVCNEATQQGLWYDFKGEFTGLIHSTFAFCQNSTLEMLYDEELVGWLSAVKNLEDLWNWFSKEDIKALQEHGWFIFEYESEKSKFYAEFQHPIIPKTTSKIIRKIVL